MNRRGSCEFFVAGGKVGMEWILTLQLPGFWRAGFRTELAVCGCFGNGISLLWAHKALGDQRGRSLPQRPGHRVSAPRVLECGVGLCIIQNILLRRNGCELCLEGAKERSLGSGFPVRKISGSAQLGWTHRREGLLRRGISRSE